jgi:hypothetical protein
MIRQGSRASLEPLWLVGRRAIVSGRHKKGFLESCLALLKGKGKIYSKKSALVNWLRRKANENGMTPWVIRVTMSIYTYCGC